MSNIKRALRNPRLLLVKALRLVNQAYHRRFYTRSHNPDGVGIFEKDWDNLIILDACRYDAFEDMSDLPGSLNSQRSFGSTTYEFIRANFAGRELYDTVYVSANGWFKYLAEQINADVHKFIGLHTSEYREETGITTPPEVVTQKAKETTEEFPNKRLIVHYLQPHSPYIGPIGREHFEMGVDIYEVLNKSESTPQELRHAYNENLQIALDEVSSLLKSLDGKTVITADHGEMLGERSSPLPFADYGHSAGMYVDELVKVPWNVVDEDSRREIISEDPNEDFDETDEEHLEEHLRDLGYKV